MSDYKDISESEQSEHEIEVNEEDEDMEEYRLEKNFRNQGSSEKPRLNEEEIIQISARYAQREIFKGEVDN